MISLLPGSGWGRQKPSCGSLLRRGGAQAAFWSFGEGGGSRVVDAGRTVAPLTLTAARVMTPWGLGIQSNSTGGDLYAAGAVPGWLSGATGDLTYLGWISYQNLPTAADGFPWNSVIGFADYQFNPGALGADDTRLIWTTASSFTTYRTFITYTLALNTWYCLGGVRRGANIEMYVNGVQVGSAAQAGPADADSIGSFEILGGGAFREAQATLAMAGVVNRALSADEMQRVNADPFRFFAAAALRQRLMHAHAAGIASTFAGARTHRYPQAARR